MHGGQGSGQADRIMSLLTLNWPQETLFWPQKEPLMLAFTRTVHRTPSPGRRLTYNPCWLLECQGKCLPAAAPSMIAHEEGHVGLLEACREQAESLWLSEPCWSRWNDVCKPNQARITTKRCTSFQALGLPFEEADLGQPASGSAVTVLGTP